MPIEEILQEIAKHDINQFEVVSPDSDAVMFSIEYLNSMGLSAMSSHLMELVKNKCVLEGPVEGFLAAAVELESKTHIIISNKYPEYNCTYERVINLVHEIGATKKFAQSEKKNDAYAKSASKWLKNKDIYPLVSEEEPVQDIELTDPEISAEQISEENTESINQVSATGQEPVKTQEPEAERNDIKPSSAPNPKPQGPKKKIIRNVIKNLLNKGLITEKQVSEAKKSSDKKTPPERALLESGELQEDKLLEVYAEIFDTTCEKIDLENIQKEAIHKLNYKQAKSYEVLPLRIKDKHIFIAVYKPLDMLAIDDLKALTEMQIKMVFVLEEEISTGIQAFYTGAEAEASGLSNALEEMDIQSEDDESESAEELIEDMEKIEGDALDKKMEDELVDLPPALRPLMNEGMPTVKLVNLIISDAVKVKCSDIHIEPREKVIDVRYRVDGDLTKIMSIPIKFHVRMLSRIKILSKLDIAMVGSPQDGRIHLTVNKKKVDFRVSIIPTFHGEKAVIRILDASEAKTDLDVLGFKEEERKLFCEAIKSPQGMVFVTGPTGSGKTSTLYAALNYIKGETVNIITVEDPIEFLNEGINQVQVNHARGVTFASALRSILRQDPNVILIGEIRDKETADIAVKASLTGHLLLSTLHTNGTIETIMRLADIGLDYYQISSALIMVVSQRLVKSICENCKEEYSPDPKVKNRFQEQIEELNIQKFYRGAGCKKCNYTGYKGRSAVFEVLKITENLKALIAKAAPQDELLKEAKDSGLKVLVESGMVRVAEGVTTLDEIIKHLGTMEQKHAHKEAINNPNADGVASRVETSETIQNRQKPKILIVDDEEGILKVLQKIITTAGYDVVVGRNGQECVEQAFRTKPDLIITDVMMPVMDGYAAVKELRSKLETAVIPVMMLSAKQDKESEIKGINFGADEYLPKPIDKEKLLTRIKMLLRRRG